nr:zinc finger, CCHC-type [Tanacetum cinerariifolium]
MKDMGEADVIFGIRIKHESNEIAISQSYYIEKVMKKFNYFDCTPVSTPMDTMGKLSRYTSNPGTQHWQAILEGTEEFKENYGLQFVYIGYPSVLEGYINASWISNTEDNSSTSGWVFLLGEGVISWASKKQTCITSSTMEFEFVSLATASKEAKWLRNLIIEIPLWSKPIAPILIRCDSAATLANAYNQMYNRKPRHLGVRHRMIRELIMNGVLSIEFLSLMASALYFLSSKRRILPSGSNPSGDVSSAGYLISRGSRHPRFLQLYIYDTQDEVNNRMHHFGGPNEGALNPEIVQGPIHVLDEHNGLVRPFRAARDKCNEGEIPGSKIKLYNMGGVRGYELPIVFKSGPRSRTDFDVIIEFRGG